MSNSRAPEFDHLIRSGGIALFPSDTVYGLACDPDNAAAVKRLYAIKQRPPEKPSARMYFDLGTALRDISTAAIGSRTHTAILELLPGPATLVLPGGAGLRVVDVPELRGATVSVLQSSANLSGQADARSLAGVNVTIRDAVDLQIDGGILPGTPSTVIDLRVYEQQRTWTILREGAIPAATVAEILGA